MAEPEHLIVSPDGTLLAIANSRSPGVTVYNLDTETHLIIPQPIYTLCTPDCIHNVRFTSDGRYLAYASLSPFAKNNESLRIYKIIRGVSGFNLELVYSGNKGRNWFRLKAINFTQDNQYIVLAYSLSFDAAKSRPFENELVAHKFNSDGTLGEIVSSVKGDSSSEDIVFLHDDTEILVSDQSADRLLIYPFDPKTGQIGTSFQVIQNPEAQLSFPHGMSVSHDEKYLAVANYGTDACNIYRIK